MPAMLPFRQTASYQVAVAQGTQKPPGPMIVHHRDDRDVPGLQHDRDLAGHSACHSDMRIDNHDVSCSQGGSASKGGVCNLVRSGGGSSASACLSARKHLHRRTIAVV